MLADVAGSNALTEWSSCLGLGTPKNDGVPCPLFFSNCSVLLLPLKNMLPFPRTRGEGDSECDGETLDEGVLLSHSLVGEEISSWWLPLEKPVFEGSVGLSEGG